MGFRNVYTTEGGEPGLSFWFWCAGCKTNHRIPVKAAEKQPENVWGWNGDREKPTFTPSIHCNATQNDPANGVHRCHFFVRDGKIQYLGDCTHELAGQTLPLEDENWEPA